MTSIVDGIPLRGEAERIGDSVLLFGVEAQNDRRLIDAHMAALHSYAESGNPRPNHSFTIHTRYDEPRARVSWIRAAYLAAFAALGWSYILRTEMTPYRQQFKRPGEEVVPSCYARDTDASADFRRIWLITEPDDVRCVAVTIGEYTLFLPGIPGWRPQTCEQLAEAFLRRTDADHRLHCTFSGKVIPWPLYPTYFLDRPAQVA